MAIVAKSAFKDKEDEKKRSMGDSTQAQSSPGMSLSRTQGASLGGSNASNNSLGQRAPSSSGSFTSLNQYVDANQDQARGMAQSVLDDNPGEVDALKEDVKSNIEAFGVGGVEDYSSLIDQTKESVDDAKNYFGKYRDYDSRKDLVPGETRGQRQLNNFLLGSDSAQEIFTDQSDMIDDYVVGLADGQADTLLDASMEDYQNNLTKQAAEQEKYDNFLNTYYGNLDSRKQRYDDATAEYQKLLDRYAQGLPTPSDWKQPRIDEYNSSKSAFDNYLGQDIANKPSFEDYSFNQSTDLDDSQMAILDALSGFGAEYELDDTDYNLEGIGLTNEDLRRLREEYLSQE